MKWSIIDPLGFEHIVEQEDDHVGYWGTENLAHCIDDLMQRPYIVSSLLYHIDKQPEQGQWEGYIWKKVDEVCGVGRGDNNIPEGESV